MVQYNKDVNSSPIKPVSLRLCIHICIYIYSGYVILIVEKSLTYVWILNILFDLIMIEPEGIYYSKK